MSSGDDAKVRVAVRIRPRLIKLGEKFDADAVQKASESTVLITSTEGGKERKTNTFTVDSVFDNTNTGEHVYEECGVDLVDAALQGLSATIFTYGQTGSGKTYTMLGETSEWTRSTAEVEPESILSDDSGLFLRALVDIFMYRQRNKNLDVSVELSILEIYNETIRDLLAQDGDPAPVLKEDRDNVFLTNVKSFGVSNVMEVYSLFSIANKSRSTSRTEMNDRSSRSHALFFIDIVQNDRAGGKPIRSRLTLVDLAGSERIKRSGVEGDRLKEAQFINKSLSSLGQVVNALYLNRAHIPYRDSKLTRLLKNSFSGNCKVLLIANLSPAETSVAESLSTMRFADRVKEMKAEQVSPADREAEQLFLRVAKEHEEVVMNLRFMSAVYGYVVCLKGDELAGDDYETKVRNMASRARVLQQENAHRKTVEEKQMMKEMVKQGVQQASQIDSDLLAALQVQLQKKRKEFADLDAQVSKLNSRQSAVDDVYRCLKEAVDTQRALTSEIDHFETEIAVLEREEDLIREVVADKETKVAREFEKWTMQFENEDRQWKEDQTKWELEKKICDAFTKIRKARQILSRKEAKLADSMADVDRLKSERRTQESTWVCQSIFSDVMRDAMAGEVIRMALGQGDLLSQAADSPSADDSVIMSPTRNEQGAASMRKQKQDVYNKQDLVNDLMKFLEHGCLMTKHGRMGTPHARHFFLTPSHDAIGWFDVEHPDGKKISSSLQFSTVERFILGQYTKVFSRYRSSPDTIQFYHSFSLTYDKGRRSLDVVADTEPDFEAWLIVLSHLLPSCPPSFGGPLDISPHPLYSSLTPEEAQFCSENHILPMVFVHTRRWLEGEGGRSITRGEMRSISSCDIHRSDVMLTYFSKKGLCQMDEKS